MSCAQDDRNQFFVVEIEINLDMSWMTEDALFYQRWCYLMKHCIKNGIEIKIIHNIDRNFTEMMDAIRSWLPLYMSGMVKPYYCELKNGQRFCHTLFLCPGVSAITSCHPIGSCDDSLIHYLTDAEQLTLLRKQFENLLRDSKELVSMHYKKPFAASSVSVTPENCSHIVIEAGSSSVIIYRTEAPYICFSFFHPLMCEAFRYFIRKNKTTDPLE